MKFDQTEINSTNNDMRVVKCVTRRTILVVKGRKNNKNSNNKKNENKNAKKSKQHP
jgi:hypothetical protein